MLCPGGGQETSLGEGDGWHPLCFPTNNSQNPESCNPVTQKTTPPRKHQPCSVPQIRANSNNRALEGETLCLNHRKSSHSVAKCPCKPAPTSIAGGGGLQIWRPKSWILHLRSLFSPHAARRPAKKILQLLDLNRLLVNPEPRIHESRPVSNPVPR